MSAPAPPGRITEYTEIASRPYSCGGFVRGETDLAEYLTAECAKRIMMLDGAMGTMIQKEKYEEEDYRGERFAEYHMDIKGNNDLLSITQPDTIRTIYTKYLLAGSDIIETNTFSGTTIAQADYHMESLVDELNIRSAELAREAVANVSAEDPSKPRFVAGAIGPTNRTGSILPDVEDPGFRNVTFDELADAYEQQTRALIKGGVDLLFVETIFDTLNAKAALFAIGQVLDEYEEATGRRMPVFVSGTIVDMSGRTLSGQTGEAFYVSIRHAKPFAVGLNCALGAPQMKPFLQRLADEAECKVLAYPNAGLPNQFGGYDDKPEDMARDVSDFATDGLVNFVGGCCGSTPPHIAAIARAVSTMAPRVYVERAHHNDKMMHLSGLENLIVDKSRFAFLNVGERCNLSGSRMFKRLIKVRARRAPRRGPCRASRCSPMRRCDALTRPSPFFVSFAFVCILLLSRFVSDGRLCRRDGGGAEASRGRRNGRGRERRRRYDRRRRGDGEVPQAGGDRARYLESAVHDRLVQV